MQALNAQSQALSQSYNSQAQQLAAESNALVAETNAAEARRAGAVEAQTLAAQAYKAKARQRAALAESGILGSATATGVINETEANAQADALNLQRKNDLEVSGLLYQAGNYSNEAMMHGFNAQTARSQANSYGQQAKSAMNSYKPSGLGSILGGLATGYGVFSGLNFGGSGGSGLVKQAAGALLKR